MVSDASSPTAPPARRARLADPIGEVACQSPRRAIAMEHTAPQREARALKGNDPSHDAGSPRVVVVAEMCSPRKGGEAILAYHYFTRLRARGVDARLVGHARDRADLLGACPGDAGRMYFVADGRIDHILFRIGSRLPSRVSIATVGLLAQLYTQWRQRRLVRGMCRGAAPASAAKREAPWRADVVHQPMPVSPKQPSWMYGLGVPVILGPMNGGMVYPPAFAHRQPWVEQVTVRVGRAFSGLMNHLIPGKRRARLLLVANQRTAAALPTGHASRVGLLPENGVDLSLFGRREISGSNGTLPDAKARAGAKEQEPAVGEPLHSDVERPACFVYLGRLVGWKAVDLLLEAWARAIGDMPGATLEIIGKGPMRDRWERLSEKLGVADSVRFAGWLSQEACAARLAESDVLVLSSLIECGGAVVLEAMATGLAVIGPAWGGPMDYVDESCGILVPPATREGFIHGLAEAMRTLAGDPAYRRRLGEAGRRRVADHFDWDRKIDHLLELYQSVVEPRDHAPPGSSAS